jgi:hypothetical protein
MLDIARSIEYLLPGATYSGAFENNTQQEYDNLIWTDARVKPTWAEIQAAAIEIIPPDNDFDPITEVLDYTQIPPATIARIGGVKIGSGMVVTPEGEVSVPSAHIQIHGLLSTDHTVSGLTPGHFLKALAGNSFGFAEHGLTFSDVGAAPANHNHAQYSLVNHNHDDVYSLLSHNHDSAYAPLVHDHDALYAPIEKGVTGGDEHDHTNGAGAQINHSGLSNLLADAHTQYPRVDGARPFTNPIGGVDPILPDHLTTKRYVDDLLGANDAMVFKGVVDCSLSPNYPEASTGHTYKVSVAGKIGGVNGIAVEVNDTLICIVDSVAGTQSAVGNNWTILQANIDGAVVGPTSSVDGNVVVFDSATGKLVKDIGLVASSVVTLNAAQTLANKTLTQPVITNFTSATHDHSDNLNGGQVSHNSLASIGPNDHHNEVHGLTSAVHTVSGLTTGQFLKAMSPTSFGFTNHGLTYSDVDAASATHNHDGVYSPIDHEHDMLYAPIVHNHDTMYAPISHGLISSSHTVSGLSTGTFLKALSSTSFGFASHGLTYLEF